LGLLISAAWTIARKEASPASVISLTHNQVRNCPINVATIRSAGSLRLSAINASALAASLLDRRRQMQAILGVVPVGQRYQRLGAC